MKILQTTSLTLVDPAKNHSKFYHLSLLETNCVTIRYGRIGTIGRSLQHQFERRTDAEAKFAELLRNKLNKGYRQSKTTAAKADIRSIPPARTAILEEFPDLL